MKLNGIEIPTPKEDIKIEEEEIANVDRTASGRLVKDVKGYKNTYTLSYDGLLPDDALTFIEIYRNGEAVEFEYEDVEGTHITNVYITSLPRSIYNPNPQFAKDITVTLEEV